jgi:hypothetical protein
VKKNAQTLVVLLSFAGAAASSRLAPEEWRWPAIGAFLFVGIIVAMRQVAAAVGKALEDKFNRDD